MRESGFYPPGAEFDPRAPWNQKTIMCDFCQGTGETSDCKEIINKHYICTHCLGTGELDV